jgi:cytochrome c-type biogenesis protein CcmF
MFVGYAATAIPFSFAMASLWRRDYTGGWAKRAFPWALGGFLVLGAAILMGGYWAYKTLGWGGYWGWDPVENASLIPWIFGTTMIHGLYMERNKGRYRRVNYILAVLTFLSVLYGTFLTRSGVLADFSVHSFVDLGISGWLIAVMGTFIAIAVYLLATRLRQVPTAPNEDPLLSRGTFMVLATIALAVAALVITAGTSAPLLTSFMENPGQVGPEFYNRVNLPIALLIALLLSLVPYLSWKGTEPRDLAKKLVWPGLFSLVATGIAVASGVHDPFHGVFVLLAALALASNFQKVLSRARAGGFSLRGAGGYLAHVGVGIMLLGFMASSAYDQSAKVTLEQGKPEKIQDMTLTFTRFIPRQGEEKEKMEVEVVKDDGERFFVYPRFFLNERTRQTMVHPDIRKTPLQDLYVSPIEFDPGQPRLELAKGESGKVGDMEVTFAGFDLNAGGMNAIAQMESGGPMTIGAMVEVKQAGRTTQLTPLYQMNPATGQVETPPMPLPGGGAVYVAGLNATNGAVQLEMTGISNPARLSVDVTRKPLIALVWYGLYVVLAGGAMAALQRLREARLLEKVAAKS